MTWSTAAADESDEVWRRRVLAEHDEAATSHLDAVPAEDRERESVRLAAQRAVLATLEPGDDLEPYPDGTTVRDVVSLGLVRARRAAR